MNIKYEKKFMSKAIELAKVAYQIDEVPVGAVLVHDNAIIGLGYNKVISKNSVSAHAEIIAINNGADFLKNYRLLNTALYCTLEPCHMCAKAIVDSRISHVFFGALEPKTGAIESIDKFFNRDDLNHKVVFSGGHMREQSSTLLRNFFQSKRS